MWHTDLAFFDNFPIALGLGGKYVLEQVRCQLIYYKELLSLLGCNY